MQRNLILGQEREVTCIFNYIKQQKDNKKAMELSSWAEWTTYLLVYMSIGVQNYKTLYQFSLW